MARVAWFAVLLCSSAAFAQQDEARRFFELGVEAQQSGDQVRAREHFEASYRLAPNSANAFQLSVTLHRLGLERESLELLDLLDSGSLQPELDAAARRQVEQLRDEVDAALGTVLLQVAGPGGEVTVDGRFAGTFERDGSLAIRVNGGVHTLHVVAGELSREIRVQVPRGGREVVQVGNASASTSDEPQALEAEPSTTQDEPPTDGAGAARRRRRGIITAVVLGVVTAVAIGTWIALSPKNDTGGQGLLEDDVFGVARPLTWSR